MATMTTEPPHAKKRRLNYLKCQFCRNSKKKCEPVDRQWPDRKCNRCIEEGLECSDNRLAGGKLVAPATSQPRPSSTPALEDKSAAGWKYFYDMSLRFTWLDHLIRYRDSTLRVKEYLMLGDPKGHCEDKHINQLQQYISTEQPSILSDISSHLQKADDISGPLFAAFSSLSVEVAAFEVYAVANVAVSRASPLTRGSNITPPSVITRLLEIGDLGTALRMQEDIAASLLLKEMNFNVIEPQVYLYRDIHQRCVDRLSAVFPTLLYLKSTPPMHNLLLSSRSSTCIEVAIRLQGLYEEDMFRRVPQSLAHDLHVRIDQSFNFNGQDVWGRTQLHLLNSLWDVTYEPSVYVDLHEPFDLRKDCEGRTALHIASGLGNAKLVRSLIDKGGDTCVQDELRQTPLLYAVLSGHAATTAILLQNTPGKDWSKLLFLAIWSGSAAVVDVLTGSRGFPGSVVDLSHLQLAIDMRKEEVVAQLLKRYPNFEERDEDGRTLLRYAAKENQEKVVLLLIFNYSAEVNTTDAHGLTPLMISALNGYSGMVSLLLNSGKANIDSQDNLGRTALHWAAGNNSDEIARMLIQKGADPYMKSRIGWTPLFSAVAAGALDVVVLLLDEAKQDHIGLKDTKDRTVLDIHKMKPNEDIRALLMERWVPEYDFGFGRQ